MRNILDTVFDVLSKPGNARPSRQSDLEEYDHSSSIKDWPDDDEALLELGPDPKSAANFWSLKDAFEGVQIFGSTGSGKSSGSGQAIAHAFLDGNLGGLVLTAKTDEVLVWKRYAAACGREADLVIVEPGGKFKFNFLSYEMTRQGAGAGHTENLVSLFCSVSETMERKSEQGGGSDTAFWQRTLKQLLRNAIDLAALAMDDVDLPSIYRIILSAAQSRQEVTDPSWQKESVCYALIELAESKAKEKNRLHDFKQTRDFWLKDFPALVGETRSIIVTTFTSMADCFLRGTLRDLFCTETTFKPEDSFEGKIIVLNLPVKEFNELGLVAQALFKFAWQRAVERRIPATINRAGVQDTIRPVFLWADESQFFVNSHDALFQSTARSSRACTIYLTQNLPSYLSAFSGPNARADAESFLGNLQTKIFHANGDPTTNNWAADSIGKTRQMQFYGGQSQGQSETAGGTRLNQNAGGSASFQFLVQPQEFTMLKTGGRDADFKVESVIFQGGRRWLATDKAKQTETNFIRHTFSQNI